MLVTFARWRAIIILLAAGAAGMTESAAQTKAAQDRAAFPTKPVRIVVPYSPGAASTSWRAWCRNR